MLVLTRKLQERIHVGDNITITVVRVQGNSVRLGVEAPKHVRVVRGEVAAKDAQAAAATVPASSGCDHTDASEAGDEADGPANLNGRGATGIPIFPLRTHLTPTSPAAVPAHAV
jgi:carbon storage regulator CsrA